MGRAQQFTKLQKQSIQLNSCMKLHINGYTELCYMLDRRQLTFCLTSSIGSSNDAIGAGPNCRCFLGDSFLSIFLSHNINEMEYDDIKTNRFILLVLYYIYDTLQIDTHESDVQHLIYVNALSMEENYLIGNNTTFNAINTMKLHYNRFNLSTLYFFPLFNHTVSFTKNGLINL